MPDFHEKSWFTPGRIIIVVVFIAAATTLVAVLQLQTRKTSTNTPANKQTNLAIASANANTDAAAANVNTASDVPNIAPAVFTSVEEPETETIVYQQGSFAFQFTAPTRWNIEAASNGSGYALERQSGVALLMSVRQQSEFVEHFRLSVRKSTDSDLFAAVSRSFENSPSTYSTERLLVGGAEAVKAISGSPDLGTPNVLTLVRNDSYIFSFEGSLFSDKTKDFAAYNEILSSFTFKDPTPTIIVQYPKSLTKATSVGTLNVQWFNERGLLNINDPLLAKEENGIYSRLYYRVGLVKTGNYQGDDIVLIIETPDGPSFQPNVYRAVFDRTTKTLTYIEKHSDNLSFLGPIYYDSGATIPDLAMPDSIQIPESSLTLRKDPFILRKFLSNYSSVSLAFTDPIVGQIYYLASMNCFVAETKDHLLQRYIYDLPFATSYRDREHFMGTAFYVPNVTWSDGTTNTVEYLFSDLGACGIIGCVNVVTQDELGGADALVKYGTTSDGDDIYFLANTDAKMLTDAYESYNVTVYQPSLKISKEEFLAKRPMFFWKDPYDQWLIFRRADLLPAVECGKPVIYLYPETTMQVNVLVSPSGGFTVTDPVYPNGGWTVTASPDGTLTTNGKTYGSLFWEGRGINYERPKRGFIIRRDEVSPFLTSILAKLGLNNKESAEFMEFWVPLMQDKPFYLVTFINQADFDRLAPLTVTPQPDTIIRVFMDYEGLDRPITVEPPTIETPERNGFTVVEWGGALHR